MSKMVQIASKDDGTGGTSASNNREYGAVIENGVVKEGTPGKVSDPTKNTTANFEPVKTNPNDPDMHTHPSGTKRGTMPDGSGATYRWGIGGRQAPSRTDIQGVKGNAPSYVYGMRDKTIYIYTNKGGVVATLPLGTFK